LLIHGARAALRFAARKRDPRSRWIGAVRERRGANNFLQKHLLYEVQCTCKRDLTTNERYQG
jgi:hypothetical protein